MIEIFIEETLMKKYLKILFKYSACFFFFVVFPISLQAIEKVKKNYV